MNIMNIKGLALSAIVPLTTMTTGTEAGFLGCAACIASCGIMLIPGVWDVALAPYCLGCLATGCLGP
eukprot:jgi/Orpsp1_1/1192462/evm.model.d7180000093474.1